MPIGFLLKYWKYGVLILFLLGIYMYWLSLTHKIEDLEQQKIVLLQNEATYKANEQRFRESIQAQNNTIIRMEQQQREDQERILNLSMEANEARKEAEDTKKKFKEHDLDRLTLSKPKWLEKLVNKGTKKVFKDLHDIADPEQIEKEIKGEK